MFKSMRPWVPKVLGVGTLGAGAVAVAYAFDNRVIEVCGVHQLTAQRIRRKNGVSPCQHIYIYIELEQYPPS